jgi:hypothetical protein
MYAKLTRNNTSKRRAVVGPRGVSVAPTRQPVGPSALWSQRSAPHLKVGDNDSSLEREAEAAAARVMQTRADELHTTPPPLGSSFSNTTLSRAPAGAGSPSSPGELSPEFSNGVRDHARRGGQPLPTAARTFFEPRFGVGLGGVRLHTDTTANILARQLDARAFTLGQDVFFGPGEARLHTPAGMRLLAHEVAHTLQSPARGRAQATRIQRSPQGSPLDPGTQQYPSAAEQDAAHDVLVPPEYQKSRGVSVSTAQDRLNFCREARAYLDDWHNKKFTNAKTKSADPGFHQLGDDELTDLHTIGTNQVTTRYADQLTNRPPEQKPLPRDHFQFVTSKSADVHNVCWRILNELETNHIFRNNNMLHMEAVDKHVFSHSVEADCAKGVNFDCGANHATDDEATKNVVGRFICEHQTELISAAEWDVGYTEISGDEQQVFIQGKFTAPVAKDDTFLDKKNEDKSRAEQRWDALMTVVHEILHTLAHPRFRALTGDKTQMTFRDVGVEGGAEYLARPVKDKIEEEIKGDPKGSLAQQITGGNTQVHKDVAASVYVKDAYKPQVDEINRLVVALGKGGEQNFKLAYFRGWIEYIGAGDAENGKPPKGKQFSSTELGSFLDERNDGTTASGIYADDKARGVVDQWKRGLEPALGSSPFNLTTDQKIVLINQMLRGITGPADEQSILVILENSSKDEWPMLFAGLDRRVLIRKFQGQRKEKLKVLVQENLEIDFETFKQDG